METQFTFRAKVWQYPGMAGWYFISLSKRLSSKIDSQFGVLKQGWGSLPVTVTIRETKWKTSIFPDKKSSAYLLPLKKEVRKKENIQSGNNINLSITILT